MLFTVRQGFFFDAAHTLNRAIETEGSRRIHGHPYRAQAAAPGPPGPATGRLVDRGPRAAARGGAGRGAAWGAGGAAAAARGGGGRR